MDDSGGNFDPEDTLREVSQSFAGRTHQVLQQFVQHLTPSPDAVSQNWDREAGAEDSHKFDMRHLCAGCGVDIGPCFALKRCCSPQCKAVDRRKREQAERLEELAGRLCKTCNSPIPVKKRRGAIYCCKNCVPRLFRETRPCGTCGKVFRIIRRTQVHCSKSCVKNSQREEIPRPCEVCNTDMAAPLPEQKYCSDRCGAIRYEQRRLQKKGADPAT